MIKLKNKILENPLNMQLYEKLRTIWDFDNWTLGVISKLKTDAERMEILKMYESGEKDPNAYQIQALKFRGIVGIPIEEFDGNPEDIINLDDD